MRYAAISSRILSSPRLTSLVQEMAFESLYEALAEVARSPQEAHEEAAKFLGLLVWNKAMLNNEEWHFTSYPKSDSDFVVTHYFAMDGHIRVKAKQNQAATARNHGDEDRAADLENDARRLMARWGR